MLQLDLPHVNVLTKIDNLPSYGNLPMPLGFYTEARSLEHLEPHLEAEQQAGLGHTDTTATAQNNESMGLSSKYHGLNRAIIELVEEFSLVGFETLCVEDRQSMWQLLRAVDKAGGYAFGGPEGLNAASAWELAVREGGGGETMKIGDVEERWLTRREELDEVEKEQWKREAEEESRRVGAWSDMKDSASRSGGVKVVRKTG